VLQQPELRETLAKQAMSTGGGPPERLAELVKSELTRWSRVVAAAKIKAD
jgi:tripartite-type tricarboxylate transporter receptor subunit TctC